MLENNSGDSWCVPRRTSYTFDSICDDACGSSAAGLKSGPPPRSRPKMSVQMGAAHQALCYFYRNPPASSGVKPQPYKDIAKLIQLPNTPAVTLRKVAQRFQSPQQARGRKPGWRKTTPCREYHILGGTSGPNVGYIQAQYMHPLGTFGPTNRVHSGTFGYIRVHSGTFGYFWTPDDTCKTM